MLSIGVVGLGNISQKAYLPVMRTIPNVKWYLCTRNKEVLYREADLFGRAVPCESIDELLNFDLDGVFIHVATSAHYEVAKKFLAKGIPVIMDKPVSENFGQTAELYQLAQEKGTFLMSAFNRRFAPKVQALKAVPDKTRIIAEKNTKIKIDDTRFRLYDILIHPLDTALYLMDDEPTSGSFFVKKVDGVVDQVTVYLENDQTTALVLWNQEAGASLENFTVQSPSGTYVVEQVTDLSIYQGKDQMLDPFGNWETTLHKRGFEPMIKAFLQAVESNGENPVSPTSSLLSHYICERIAGSKATAGFLTFDLGL